MASLVPMTFSHPSPLAGDDGPRERLRRLGPGALTVVELLAILLGTGAARRHALVVAADLLAAGGGSLRALARRPAGALAGVPGVGGAKAARVSALPGVR